MTVIRTGQLSDSEILALFRERNERGIEAAKEKYGALTRSIARNILGNTEDAEECENDAYLRLWNTIPPAAPQNLTAYTAKTVRNLALDRYRAQNAGKRGSHKEELPMDELADFLSGGDEPESEYQKRMFSESLNRFLASLPADVCNVFLMRYWYGDSLKEISRSSGYSVPKIKTMLMRTRNKLKEHLLREGYTV